MAEHNFNKVTGVFGARSTGKTTFLRGHAQLGVKGIVPIYLKKRMKVLIVDTIDHVDYRDVPPIKAAELKTWGMSSDATIRRVWVSKDDMPRLNKIINTTFWNGLLVYEDAYKHQEETLDQSIKQLIGDSKQKNVDLMFMYHTWFMAPLDLYRYLDYVEVFKTVDGPESRKSKIQIAGYWDEAVRIHQQVRDSSNRYIHLTIKTGV